MDAIGYADTADKASKADASGILAADLPEIDPVTKHAGMQDAIAAMEAVVIDADKPREARRAQERVQDTAEREALEELAAEAKAAKARAKRKSTKQAAHEGGTGLQETFDVGEDEDIEAHTSDSWGIVGRDVSIPNVAWRGEIDDGRVAICRVVGLAPRMYVVSTGGFHYTFSVAHMRIYMQTTENARLLHDLGGVAAIKSAPTTQAIGTLAKRKATSRRASTPTTRLMLASMFLLGLACGGQAADPGGSDDPMDDGLSGRPPAPHGDAELLATLQSWADRARAPVVASPQLWGRRARGLFAASGSDFPVTIEQHVRLQSVAAARARAEVGRAPRPLSQWKPGCGRWRRAIRHTWIRCSIGTNSGCIRRTGTTIRCSIVMLRQPLGEWSRRMLRICLARKKTLGTCARTLTIISTVARGLRWQMCRSSLRMETSSMSG